MKDVRFVTLVPLLSLLATAVLWIPLKFYWLGALPALVFLVSLWWEDAERKRHYAALASAVLILTLSPISTDLSPLHFLTLGTGFLLAIIVPTLLLRGTGTITFQFFPKEIDKIDIFYTAIGIPLAMAGVWLYFQVLSPNVPFNWMLPPEPNNGELFKLFMGINAVGIWDELFFINVSYAIIRKLFPYRIANPAQAVIYTSMLYTMAFRGWGAIIVYIFAFTQGAMYERSKSLIWVLLVHLMVDYFLFQGIVSAYYPNLDVWWH